MCSQVKELQGGPINLPTHLRCSGDPRILSAYLLVNNVRRCTCEWEAPKRPHENAHPQRPHVHLVARYISRSEALWRPKCRCAEARAAASIGHTLAARNNAAAKVGNLDSAAVAVQKKVGRLEVAMHNSVGMQVVQTLLVYTVWWHGHICERGARLAPR
jgi:hypothetical protein